MSGLAPGGQWSFRYTVTDADTAAALNPITGDNFPAVLATTRCIALLELAVTAGAEIRSTPDFREGLAAFLEKRAPRWGSL